MPITSFVPRHMKLSILTAALQELTSRERRDADPDLSSTPPLSGLPRPPAQHGRTRWRVSVPLDGESGRALLNLEP